MQQDKAVASSTAVRRMVMGRVRGGCHERPVPTRGVRRARHDASCMWSASCSTAVIGSKTSGALDSRARRVLTRHTAEESQMNLEDVHGALFYCFAAN